MDWEEIGRESVELFKGLLRLDTTNPPGNEHLAAEYLAQSLREDGLEPWIVESAPGRANLVVRLPATVDEPTAGPLLLAGHTDVVPARAEEWTHPPFAGTEADGFVWGRGAVDMKNMVAMSVMTAKLLARQQPERHRDLIVAAVADEEEGCTYGSKFLVDEHPERVRAEYMLGEVGGFWQHVGGRTYVPIMVAEKGQAHLRLSARGPSGHGAIPHEDNALARLARAVERLSSRRLPHHTTPVMEHFIKVMADTQPVPARFVLPRLLNPKLAGPILDHVLPDPSLARSFAALLHNTVSPTILHAGEKRNVIPDEASCELDGRMLPGFDGDDLRREVAGVVDDPAVEIEVLSEASGVQTPPDTPLFDTIRRVINRHAPEAVVAPYMIPGYTDARHFSRLGTKCYGCSPLMISESSGIRFADMFHGVDERVSVEGYVWGQRVLYEIVETFLAAR